MLRPSPDWRLSSGLVRAVPERTSSRTATSPSSCSGATTSPSSAPPTLTQTSRRRRRSLSLSIGIKPHTAYKAESQPVADGPATSTAYGRWLWARELAFGLSTAQLLPSPDDKGTSSVRSGKPVTKQATTPPVHMRRRHIWPLIRIYVSYDESIGHLNCPSASMPCNISFKRRVS